MGQFFNGLFLNNFFGFFPHQRDGVVVRASASQSINLGFNPLVESYQKIHVENKPESSLVVSLGKALNGMPPPLCGKIGDPDTPEMATPKRVRTSRPKYSNTMCFLVNGR